MVVLGGIFQAMEGEVNDVDPWDFFQWQQRRMIGFSIKQTPGGKQNLSVPMTRINIPLVQGTSQISLEVRSLKLEIRSSVLEVLLSYDK